ncbi:MAG: response regulator [Acidobacteriota bacterium]|jgi:CheY-like chemotaxis protein
MKILIVDDDRLLRAIMSDGLSAEGATCVQAASGEEALKQVLRERPDVCLFDQNLPDTTGLELLALLKRRPETSGIKVFLVTGSAEGDLKEQAAASGAEAVLRKPIVPSQVMEKLRAR